MPYRPYNLVSEIVKLFEEFEHRDDGYTFKFKQTGASALIDVMNADGKLVVQLRVRVEDLSNYPAWSLGM